MQAVKIVVGLLILLGGLNNLKGVFNLPNPRQAAGYLIATLFFIILGGWLLYSGVRQPPKEVKIYDDSDSE